MNDDILSYILDYRQKIKKNTAPKQFCALLKKCGFGPFLQHHIPKMADKFTLHEFKKNDILFEEGALSDDYYLILYGHVKLIRHGVSGREILLRKRGAASCFGTFSAIDQKPREASLVAIDRLFIARVSGDDYRHFIKQNPDFVLKNIKSIIGEFRLNYDRIANFNQYNVAERLSLELLKLHHAAAPNNPQNHALIIPTHNMLATYIDATREEISRTLSRFIKSGLLYKDGQRTILKNRTALADVFPSTDSDDFSKKSIYIESYPFPPKDINS